MTEKKYKAGTTAYFSNPNGPVEQHCAPWELKIDMDELPWHVHEKKPDESLVDPVWSDEADDWVDFSAKTMPEQIAQLQKQADDLKKQQENYQQSITNNATDTTEVKQTLDKVQDSQAQILDMVSQLMMMGSGTPTPVPPIATSDETTTDDKEE